MDDRKRRVGDWIQARAEELGLNVTRLAELSGISRQTLTSAIAGRSEIKQNRAALEDSLQWQRGSIRLAYRDGEAPRLLVAQDGNGGPVRRFKEMVVRVRNAEQERIVRWWPLRRQRTRSGWTSLAAA